MQLTVNVTNTVETQISRYTQGLGNFSKPLEVSGDQIVEYLSGKVFDSQGAEAGQVWQDLAPTTLMARSRRTGYYANSPIETNKTLIWTGRLKSSFIKAVESMKCTISNTADYFKYHQTGGGRLPMRKIMTITKEMSIIVSTAFKNYISSL